MQTWRARPNPFAKAQNNTLLLWVYAVKTGRAPNQRKNNRSKAELNGHRRPHLASSCAKLLQIDGLSRQRLVEAGRRHLDPTDHRRFRRRLGPTGRRRLGRLGRLDYSMA